MFYRKAYLKDFPKLTGKTSSIELFITRTVTFPEKVSTADAFLCFSEQFFHKTPPDDCFLVKLENISVLAK